MKYIILILLITNIYAEKKLHLEEILYKQKNINNKKIIKNITGKYKGIAYAEINNNISINIEYINPKKLSKYLDVFPTTGGKRVFLYFDTTGDNIANYCGFIYKKTMILKKESTGGFYNILIDYMPIIHKHNQTHIVIPKEYFENKKIHKIWTYKTEKN